MAIVAGSADPTNPEIARKKARFIQKKNIANVKIHPNSAYPAARNDLALVEIEGKFRFRNSRWPICIPEVSAPRDSHSRIGYTMLGFGRDINREKRGNVLTELDMTVQPTSACSTLYGRILDDQDNDYFTQTRISLPKNFDEESLICSQKPGKSSGSCPGDSGGLIMKNEWVDTLEDYRAFQVAVIHGAAQKCNGQRYPQILIRLDTSETISWINSIVFSKGGMYLLFCIGQPDNHIG